MKENDYHLSLKKEIEHFLAALRHYTLQPVGVERQRLASVMEGHLKVILATVPEIKRLGIHKEAVAVENAFKAYMKSASAENYAALEHTVVTLNDFNC
ncbi:MAG TPA: hypothetical protein VLE96_04830 [Chlamydiales bacterium]|nr:hypothetical protein [Chlamydiales bacterium]